MKKETPILFSTPMVQALLNGTKTQTRRVVKDKHLCNGEPPFSTRNAGITGVSPYGKVGDLLYVRETFGYNNAGDIRFKTDVEHPIYDKPHTGWKPSLFMPKAAARLWLQITGIRVERLQAITETDAIAEGVERIKPEGIFSYRSYAVKQTEFGVSPYVSYRTLWQAINSPDSWRANPWVWVIEFKVISKTGKP